MAVAVDRRNPGTDDSASSPMNWCGTSRVTVASLPERLLGLQFNDPSAKSGASEEFCEIELGWSSEGHPWATFRHLESESI